ncbi:hypothetical protein SUGI_0544440 [Cryptomeria japonica]|nr:hypothetical protein SUGI_0544440 [Cryptomeria japonica]
MSGTVGRLLPRVRVFEDEGDLDDLEDDLEAFEVASMCAGVPFCGVAMFWRLLVFLGVLCFGIVFFCGLYRVNGLFVEHLVWALVGSASDYNVSYFLCLFHGLALYASRRAMAGAFVGLLNVFWCYSMFVVVCFLHWVSWRCHSLPYFPRRFRLGAGCLCVCLWPLIWLFTWSSVRRMGLLVATVLGFGFRGAALRLPLS